MVFHLFLFALQRTVLVLRLQPAIELMFLKMALKQHKHLPAGALLVVIDDGS
jgi:hypothetical protein